jgi:deoxyribodipyrimidine photolyase
MDFFGLFRCFGTVSTETNISVLKQTENNENKKNGTEMLRNQTLLKKFNRKCVATYCKQVTTNVAEPKTSQIRI